MQPSYLPATDSAFDAWFSNFATLIAAAPATYGLVVGDATIITASQTAWAAAYLAAITPATRTSPTIAAKDAQRILSTSVIRPYATQISRNPAVANIDKTAVGVNLPNSARTPVPQPSTVPALSLVSAIHFLHTLAYRDTSTPTSKAKPPGAIGLELYRTLATPADPVISNASPVGVLTKSPNNVGYLGPEVGKTATYWGRWVTRSGPSGATQNGPWSAPLAVVVT